MEEMKAFCEFLSHRQPPRSLTESTADDAIEYLLTLPSERFNEAVSRLSEATFNEIDGDHPFNSPMVRTFLQERVKAKEQANNEKEDGDKKRGGRSDGDQEILFEISHGHRATELDPVLVISCGEKQDSEEGYLISYISKELRLRGFTPLIYDLTRSTLAGGLEMLHRSRVGIVIFSKNYACSKQCMGGFVEIMDHSEASNLVLIPVFFKVEVTDIRGQSGSFGRAFSRLEDSVLASQVPTLTSINKYQYMKGDEVILAKNLISDVCLLLSSETNMNLRGRLQMKSILSLLNCSQLSAPHIVGLWGMAGIGKTTIAREIFRTQADRYDVCYFLPDFHIACQTRGLGHLRDEFFSKICGEEKVTVDACDTKLGFLRDRFLSKKVLVVLDGVSNARDAEFLVGGFGWLSGGHTLILTSRNRQVLVQCNAKEICEIKKLSEHESLHLFSQFATEQNWKERTSLVSELVNYASGIPLALCALGSSLQNQCINDEKQHLKRLRQHPLVEIQDAFKRSFNVLDDNEKNTFLDLACFFRGENKDYVVNILDGCGFLTELGIYGLIDESLISIVGNKIEMPNIFQDTGRFVVCQESNETGKRSRLWDPTDIVDVLTNNSGTEAIEGMFLDSTGLTFELSPTAFEKMYRLRFLKLYCPTSKNHCNVSLPQGLYSLPDELRLLHWERCPLESLPRNFNPKNIVELNMPYSNMTKLWKGTKNLENLKRIILSHSRRFIKFPSLSKARNLEHIDLEGCTSLVKVNSSILHHHKLIFLNLKDCSHLQIMPTTVHLEALEVLNLSGCSELEDLQDFSPNLSELYLAGTAITEIPSSIGGLIRLVTLDLENCNRLQHLPPELSNLKAVVSLSAKHHALSKDSRDLSSFEDAAQPCRKYPLKRVIETVIRSIRKMKREKSVSVSTNLSEVKLGSDSTSASDLSYNTSWGFFDLPERPGRPECIFYMKTGHCKFANDCKFHHPRDRETHVTDSSLSSLSHPSRPETPVCASYFYTGNCSSGATCMFDHPSLVPTHRNTSFMASLTPYLNQRGFSSSPGDSSSELVDTETKRRRIRKNTSSMHSVTRHSCPLGISSSPGDSSSEPVEEASMAKLLMLLSRHSN